MTSFSLLVHKNLYPLRRLEPTLVQHRSALRALSLLLVAATSAISSACSPAPAIPPAAPVPSLSSVKTPPLPDPTPTQDSRNTGQAPDPSLPPAATVLKPADGAASAPDARSNKAMSSTQESSAMPLPGQNNDHSAPLTPANRASAPLAR